MKQFTKHDVHAVTLATISFNVTIIRGLVDALKTQANEAETTMNLPNMFRAMRHCSESIIALSTELEKDLP